MSRFILFTFSLFALLSCNEQSSQGEAFLQEVDQNAAGEVYGLELEHNDPKPNAFEVFPTGGIASHMYGPSTLTTQVEGQAVTVHQRTNYPYEQRVAFEVETDTLIPFGQTTLRQTTFTQRQ